MIMWNLFVFILRFTVLVVLIPSKCTQTNTPDTFRLHGCERQTSDTDKWIFLEIQSAFRLHRTAKASKSSRVNSFYDLFKTNINGREGKRPRRYFSSLKTSLNPMDFFLVLFSLMPLRLASFSPRTARSLPPARYIRGLPKRKQSFGTPKNIFFRLLTAAARWNEDYTFLRCFGFYQQREWNIYSEPRLIVAQCVCDLLATRARRVRIHQISRVFIFHRLRGNFRFHMRRFALKINFCAPCEVSRMEEEKFEQQTNFYCSMI